MRWADARHLRIHDVPGFEDACGLLVSARRPPRLGAPLVLRVKMCGYTYAIHDTTFLFASYEVSLNPCEKNHALV